MSDNIEYIDVDSDDFYDAPKALREAYRKLKQAHESDRTELKQVRGQLASQAIGGVLTDKGFKNPKRVERDLLSDGIDPHDSKAVEGWLAENGDDYAKGEVAPASETPVVPPEEQLAHEQLQVGGDLRTPADMSKLEAVQAEAGKDVTGEELLALYKKHGL